jgi:hypothetical protein
LLKKNNYAILILGDDMRKDLENIKEIINILKNVESLNEYKENNSKAYEDNLYIIEQFSKLLARESINYKEPELEELDKSLNELSEKHEDLKEFVNKVKIEVQVWLFTKQLVEDVTKIINEPNLEKYQLEQDKEYDKQIGRIIDNYNYIKENTKYDSLELYLATKKINELMSTHKELKGMCEELLYSNEHKKVDLDELKKQREQNHEAQLKNDKLESNLKALSVEITGYYKKPGFDNKKYKDFSNKLADYDTELKKLKDNMPEEQYNRILDEFYRAQGNLEALNQEMLKQIKQAEEQEIRGNFTL